jgi:hypothetical protein
MQPAPAAGNPRSLPAQVSLAQADKPARPAGAITFAAARKLPSDIVAYLRVVADLTNERVAPTELSPAANSGADECWPEQSGIDQPANRRV